MDTTASLSHIGQRLQTLRRAQGLTLEQLASDSGLSTGYLSQIENGAAVPSLTALHLIAAELGVELATFFPEARRHGTRLIRASDRHEFRVEPGSGEEYAVLAGQVHDRAFSALYARHLPGAGGSERPFRHLGEEFGLVMKGILRLTIEGVDYDLGPGDWIHYSSHPSHSAHVVSDEPVEALWLLTPAVI
ncbi:MAG: helix-turn-helix domain-containing protein [Gaiellaceae bacterium]